MNTIGWLITGGFAKGYRTQILGLVTALSALASWAVGDATLIDLLVGGAVEVHQAIEPFRAGTRDYPAGTSLVLMAQPFRAYAKTLLERQEYPVRRLLPGAPPERPYDVAGWTLPYQMGVAVDVIDQPFGLPALSRPKYARWTGGLPREWSQPASVRRSWPQSRFDSMSHRRPPSGPPAIALKYAR